MRPRMPEEGDRCRLIGEIAKVLRHGAVPDDAHAAGLTLIAWLARRMPGEGPSQDGVAVMVERSAELAETIGDALEDALGDAVGSSRRESADCSRRAGERMG